MEEFVARWSSRSAVFLLCHSDWRRFLWFRFVLTPMWRKAPPSSFSVGYNLGRDSPCSIFWIPVHVAITLFIILALVMTWD